MFKHIYMKYLLGLDIGGTHIAGALVNASDGEMSDESYHKHTFHTSARREDILEEWIYSIECILKNSKIADLEGIGIAMPGPFDYVNGISLMKGLEKYDALYGMNIKDALKTALGLPENFPVCFRNDAVCFALGEAWKGAASAYQNVVAITLGTGLGAAFLENNKPIQHGENIPEGGTLYQIPYKGTKAEDYFSSRGILKRYEFYAGEKVDGVKAIYDRAMRKESVAIKTFSDFGNELAAFLEPWLFKFDADCLVMGGGISMASCFFIDDMKKRLKNHSLFLDVITSNLGDKAAILGAVKDFKNNKVNMDNSTYRKTNQYLLPVKKDAEGNKKYDIYPAFQLGDNKIYEGIDSLVEFIIAQKTVIMDGYAGVFWDKLKSDLAKIFPQKLKVNIADTRDWFLNQEEIDKLVMPYLGSKDSVWGTKCDKVLKDFFNKEKISNCLPDPDCDINIILGTGAALSSWKAPVIYFDMPKNELQYRMRAGSVTNLGNTRSQSDDEAYKRFYFVDWVLLNKHKKNILNKIEIIADSQRPDNITWMFFKDLECALQTMSENVFRVRPWFEAGAWGGQWIKKNLIGINREEVNYAWAFELITPENGLLFESKDLLLEVSFDFIMFLFNKNILGKNNAARFGDDFPIRFDFLDTVEGGNLSIQCHPSEKYIKENFGENFTQDETYYILDADKDAGVYLGFQEDIDPQQFREELEQSNQKSIPVEITRYVQYHPAKKHDFFLIPNSTIHSAGKGNLVLEISATPYIFTFKMYDWLRPDLDGEPRPINIEHAFNNLDFSRKGEKVKKELISKPVVINAGKDCTQIHLATHPQHFYDVDRYEFKDKVEIKTKDSCHVLMLVEGDSVLVETKSGFKQRFHYAETFVIPAAAESYVLMNEGEEVIKVVKAFLKD